MTDANQNPPAETPAVPAQATKVDDNFGDPESGLLFLPDRVVTGQQFTSRKTTYHVGQITEFTFKDVNDHERRGYLDLTHGKIRLIRVAGRPQQSQGINKLILGLGIVLDGEIVGMLNDKDETVPHPLYVEPRYKAWNDRVKRPHRINAQQWVNIEANGDLVMEAVNYLHTEHSWQIIQNPAKGAQRQTRDLFVARPVTARSDDPNAEPVDLTTVGVQLDSFEVSVNPDYAAGFKSFYNGLDEQMKRWEDAAKQQNEDVRRKALEQLSQNIHFIGGAYNDTNNRSWGRPVDVGAYDLDQRHFPFYEAKGTGPLTEDLFAPLLAENAKSKDQPAGSAPSIDDLDLGEPLTSF